MSSTIVIGSPDCPISTLIITLGSSSSFSLLNEKWSNVARRLEASSTLVKTLSRQFHLGINNLEDTVYYVVEDWIGRNGDEATLEKFLKILEDNELRACAEHLEKTFITCSATKTVKKYFRIPKDIEEFISPVNTHHDICIVPTFDIQITCIKLQEKLKNSLIFELYGFLNHISGERDNKNNIIATLNSITELELVIRDIFVLSRRPQKLFLVTIQENGPLSEDLLKRNPLWKNRVKICPDNMEWDDLSPVHKHEIRMRLKRKLKINISGELSELLKGSILAQLINDDDLALFKHTIPTPLNYYVPRKLLTRNLISDGIFAEKSSSVFLFIGLELYRLQGMVKQFPTGNTRRQLAQSKIRAMFMIQDREEDFDRVCQKFTKHQKSIHLLEWEKGEKLRWLRSVGRMTGLQKFVLDTQEPLSEEEFIQVLKPDSNLPIIICDTPGMGKSRLLEQLGRKLAECPDKCVVFLRINNLIQELNRIKRHDKEAVITALANLVCVSNFEEAVFKLKLSHQARDHISIELMLDGFDEIDSAHLESARQMIGLIVSSFQSVRLWVTSRPHYLMGLENTLQVLGYNIRPFTIEDQITFLTLYWTSESTETELNQEKLNVFAFQCLKDLKTKMNSEDYEITGIPLQCLLVGEMYQDEAVEFAKFHQTSIFSDQFEITSITNLYEGLIQKKLNKYNQEYEGRFFNATNIVEIHAPLAVEFLFPEIFNDIKTTFVTAQPNEDILKLGIVISQTTAQTSGFLHRTFAEYFVAKFLVERLKNGVGWSSDLTKFLFNSVLNCQKTWFTTAKHNGATTFKFIYPVIMYFVNYIIGFQQDIQSTNKDSGSDLSSCCSDEGISSTSFIPINVIQLFTVELESDKQLASQITHACANASLVHFYKFMYAIPIFEKVANSEFDSHCTLQMLILQHSTSDLLEQVFPHFEINMARRDEATQYMLLRIAVCRGDYSIFRILIQNQQLFELAKMSPLLLGDCVELTDGISDNEIIQRLHLIEMLYEMNRDFIQETYRHTNPFPLLSSRVHVQLMIKMIEMGADVLAKNNLGDTILHMSSDTQQQLSIKNYELFLKNIPKDKLRKLINATGANGDTPIVRLLKEADPSREVFQEFTNAGFKFNSANPSLLEISIKYGRNESTLKALIDLGADMEYKKGLKTLLHIATESGNMDAARILVEKLNVNAPDDEGLTPLDYVIQRQQYRNRLEIGKLLHDNEGTFKAIENSDEQTWLHVAALRGDCDLVQLLLHFKYDINQVDKDDNTPLHFGVQFDDTKFSYYDMTKLLLHNKANPYAINRQGMTPFSLALTNKNLDYETYTLFKSTTDVEWTPELATLAMIFVTRIGQFLNDDEFQSAIQDLLRHGADINCKIEDGNSPIHIAVDKNVEEVDVKENIKDTSFETIRYLIDNGANVNAKNKFGQTPLHRAAAAVSNHAKERSLKTMQNLIEAEANVLEIDDKQCTFLHIFLSQGIEPSRFQLRIIVQYLIGKQLLSLFDSRVQSALAKLECGEETIFILESAGVLLRPTMPTTNGVEVAQGSVTAAAKELVPSDVVEVLRTSDSFSQLRNTWMDLARVLGVSSSKTTKIRNDMNLGIINLEETLMEIITEWKMRNGSSATVQKLIYAFEGTKDEASADALQKAFWPTGKDYWK